MSKSDQVREFHKLAGIPLDRDLGVDPRLMDKRLKLITEEVRELALAAEELKDCFNARSVAGFLKEMADVQYALQGMAETFGLPMDPAFNLTHASNMTKPEGDHSPKVSPEGKVIRGKNYRDPDLIPLAEDYLKRQRPRLEGGPSSDLD